MTLLEKLQGRIGDLIKIDCKLYWSNTTGWQPAQQRFCVLLDVMSDPDCPYDAVSWNVVASGYQQSPDVILLLLIDGLPKWIALNKKDIKVVK